jgi:hypothetical protein
MEHGHDVWSWRRWGDNIKMYLKETGITGVHWIHQAQDRGHWYDNVNGRSGSIKYEKYLEQLCDYQLLKKDSAPLVNVEETKNA